MMIRYDILVTHDPDSGLYLAEVPDLPGCYSQGITDEEATANIRESIALHLQTLREAGNDVPPQATHALRSVEVAMA
jgi:predicted RNase H-like HicB family nuclease